MRIISGKNKGRQIVAPDNLPVRPTTDLGKESLFNILNNYFYFDRIKVLDLFSGTGNLTYEFASRGAISVIAVDADQRCTNFIKKTIEKLDYQNVAVIRQDAFQYTGIYCHFMSKTILLSASIGFFRSLSLRITSPTSGQSIATSGSFQAIPPSSSG